MTKPAQITVIGDIQAYRASWTCPHCAQSCKSLIPQGTRWKIVRCGKCRQGVELLGVHEIAEARQRQMSEAALTLTAKTKAETTCRRGQARKIRSRRRR